MKATADWTACCLPQPPQAGRVLRGVGVRAAADSGCLLLRPAAGQCGEMLGSVGYANNRLALLK